MNITIDRIKDSLSLRTLVQGFLLALLPWILIYGTLAYRADETLKDLEDHLASKVVNITREDSQDFLSGESSHQAESSQDHAQSNEEDPSAPLTLPSPPEESAGGENALSEETQPLSPAPFDGLFEKTKSGLLPHISDKGLTPFQAYRQPLPPGKSGPFIALAVMNYGLSEERSSMTLKELPASVSLILSPYSTDPQGWQERARKNGHEIWMQIPTETVDFPASDPGSQALLSRTSLKKNQERVEWAMTRTTGYAGVVAQVDQSFGHVRPMIQTLSQTIFERGLGYLELSPASSGFIESVALKSKAPYAQNTAFIRDSSQIFHTIEKAAQENGSAVAVIIPTPNNIKITQKWLSTLEKRGFSLVPVSALSGANL